MIKQIHLSECDSTQEELKEQLTRHSHWEEMLVSCEYQRLGRGRGDHSWTFLPGSVCFSLSIKAHPVLSLTALEISLLIAKFFESKGAHLKLKWPNDLWDQEKQKCGGILVQGSKESFMAGIGLNLFPHESFGGVFKSEFEFKRKDWSFEIAEFISRNRQPEALTVIDEWTSRCGHLNMDVSITDGEEKVQGRFMGLGNNGEALIQTSEGLKKIYNGSLRIING